MENTKTILIEKNIPYPAERKHHPAFPFDEMEVGDSFVVEVNVRPQIYSAMKQYRPKHFISRIIEDSGRTKERVWRVG